MYEPVWDEDGREAGKKHQEAEQQPRISRTLEKQTVRVIASKSLQLSSYAELTALLQQPFSKFARGDPRDLIQIRPPALCSVCYNLDPYAAPQDRSGEDGTRAWAKAEYAIPPDTPVAKIKISKSAELLESAQHGCLTCAIIATSLSGVSPGWEEGESFMHLFLAPNLPLVVRLQHGSTSSLRTGKESMVDLGVLLPEGSAMNWDIEITVSEEKKPQALEIEIYKRNIAPEQSTVGDLVLGELIRDIGTATPVSQHAGSVECYKFIKTHVERCMLSHNCSSSGHLPKLPDRVIWVKAPQSETPSGIRLVESQTHGKKRAPYLTLSYCWGPVSPSTFMTDESSLETHKAGIAYTGLPPLFQDVVDLARLLGIEYVWIDRLCIVQGSSTDFARQAPKMGTIYGNATLTIAAASATSESDRILVERDLKWSTYDLKITEPSMGKLSFQVRRRSQPLGMEARGGDYGKVSTRAWIWQERMLSARTIFFTQSALKFECHAHSIWEGFGEGVTGPSWSAQLDNVTYKTWMNLVEEYTQRDITRPADRLPAMAATMRRIAKARGWSPLYGMWASAPIDSLGWHAKEWDGPGFRHLCRVHPGFYAPTWSWASVEGPVSYVNVKRMDAYDPAVADLEVTKWDAASGVITVRGRVIATEVRCEVTESPFPEEEEVGDSNPSASEEKTFDYHYNIPGLTQRGVGAMPITADVALQPWTGVINGENVSTVIRVPDGELWPEKSWSGNCLCLMVQRQTLRCLVLVLGQSRRVPGAWERIATVDGLEPTLFDLAARVVFEIA
ncbi:HET-domain-containing protein [Parathielavia appendiculata]|uniref:HET-domain-containing protein n=1 Tax=Parathielavia appendiculata TaxID=2587402 RepID=A0AAN6YZX4_9PEZI|nr:HET-domain-containing protein [Parathielavia appendiculata]